MIVGRLWSQNPVQLAGFVLAGAAALAVAWFVAPRAVKPCPLEQVSAAETVAAGSRPAGALELAE
jgi:hypothetical protein